MNDADYTDNVNLPKVRGRSRKDIHIDIKSPQPFPGSKFSSGIFSKDNLISRGDNESWNQSHKISSTKDGPPILVKNEDPTPLDDPNFNSSFATPGKKLSITMTPLAKDSRLFKLTQDSSRKSSENQQYSATETKIKLMRDKNKEILAANKQVFKQQSFVKQVMKDKNNMKVMRMKSSEDDGLG